MSKPCNVSEFDCRCGGDIYQTNFLNPECIPKRWRCDGTPDCANGRDELDCICPDGFIQCGCNKGGECDFRFQCIPKSQECNGVQDCESFNDERAPECAFECKNSSTLILNHLKCDGKRDCLDFSDEANCTLSPPKLRHRCDCNKIGNFTCTGNKSFFSEDGTGQSEKLSIFPPFYYLTSVLWKIFSFVF